MKIAVTGGAGFIGSHVFGPRQDPKSPYAAAVPIFIERALKNEIITIHGSGEQTRDFIYVKDIVAANAFFATQSSTTGVFNVRMASELRLITWRKVFATLRTRLLKSDIRQAGQGMCNIRLQVLTSFIRQVSPPKGSVVDGLKATVDFFRDR